MGKRKRRERLSESELRELRELVVDLTRYMVNVEISRAAPTVEAEDLEKAYGIV